MLRTTLLTVLIIAGWIAPPALAESYRVLGDGKNSCGSWTETRKSAGAEVKTYSAWLSGYVTAFDRWQHADDEVTAETDFAGLRAWVDQFCQQNPLDNIADAAEALVVELQDRATADLPTKSDLADSPMVVLPTIPKAIQDRIVGSPVPPSPAPDLVSREDSLVDAEP